ncbi:hypothetical protein MASR2M74_20490 [Paracoccaceae bacterium]
MSSTIPGHRSQAFAITTKTTLRLEGLTVLAVGLGAALSLSESWLPIAGLFLLPDIGMAGYLAGPRVGAVTYNLAHSYVLPLVLLAIAATILPWLMVPALVWIAHIGFDRALGYGLKQVEGFRFTHLGNIGK